MTVRASQLCQENRGTQKQVKTRVSPASPSLPGFLHWGAASDWFPVQKIHGPHAWILHLHPVGMLQAFP